LICLNSLSLDHAIRLIGAFAATPTIQDQEVERPVFGDHAPVTVEHPDVGKAGEKRLAGRG